MVDGVSGHRGRSDELLPLVYDELRRLADFRLAKEPAGHTLQPTALVHEAYMRLLRSDGALWDNRGHFFAAAAEAMRRILVEWARRKRRIKHGGGRAKVPLPDDVAGAAEPLPDDLVALDDVLDKLQHHDARKQQVVMLRYFAGLSVDETAAILGVSDTTVERDWSYARAWLYREIVRTAGD